MTDFITNFLSETIIALNENGKLPSDVEYVGSRDGTYSISWEQFEAIANFKYDGGYGAQEIAEDIIVVGDNWWMERHEYDGSEWWEFKTMPVRKPETKEFSKIHTRSYTNGDSIGQLNREEKQ